MNSTAARLRAALRESRVDETLRGELRGLRKDARRCRQNSDLDAAVRVLAAAHEHARNLPLGHARVHLSLVHVQWRAGRRWEAARELERAALAPVASGLRRVAGLRPADPVGPGLWHTAQGALAVIWP